MPPLPLPDGQIINSEDYRSSRIERVGRLYKIVVERKNFRTLEVKGLNREEAEEKAKQIQEQITELQHPSPGLTPRSERNLNRGIGENTVFIGHGHSPVWRDLRDFLEKRLGLTVVEFDSVPVAGKHTTNRLEDMLNAADFAFLVMTAEDATQAGTHHARLNVVHEAGLFQGRLGFDKAIILLEEECEEFSNIRGLGYIAFAKNNILSSFEKVRAVLEREEIIRARLETPARAARVGARRRK